MLSVTERTKAYIETAISGLIIRQCANHVADGSHNVPHTVRFASFAERANGDTIMLNACIENDR